jgi:hypothetical protein
MDIVEKNLNVSWSELREEAASGNGPSADFGLGEAIRCKWIDKITSEPHCSSYVAIAVTAY